MRNLNILFVFVLFFTVNFLSCTDDSTPTPAPTPTPVKHKKVQYALGINYTATYNKASGSLGDSIMNKLYNINPSKVIFIAVHMSQDPMYCPDLYRTLSITGQRITTGTLPIFYIGDDKTDDASSVKALLKRTPKASVFLDYKITGNEMKIETETKFFSSGSGEYFISVLLLEDGIDGSKSAPTAYQQKGTKDPDFKHNFVLRASPDNVEAYGQLLVRNPKADEIIKVNKKITLKSEWKNPYPVAIVWHKNTSSFYEFVNAYKK